MNRPPVGFVVEGHGEYNCYPSLFCRSVGVNGILVPRINAGGCGSVVKRLSEQLTDLFLTESPINVIVTVDLQDILDQNLANTCVELLEILDFQIDDWLKKARSDKRLHPLPERVICIVQIRMFESWLISDINGLKSAGLLGVDVQPIDDAEAVDNPMIWLKNNLVIDGNIKSPRVAKQITSAIDPNNMRKHSKSFDKFFRECVASYDEWVNSS